MSNFMEYVEGESVLHRMNPIAKLVCAIVLCVACFCSSSLPFLLGMVAVGFALATASKLVGPTLGLARAVLIFSLILAVIQVLSTPSGALLVALPWGYIGTGSPLAAATTVVRLVAASIPLCIALRVTKLSDITNSLVKVAHVPYRYAFTFTSAIRFIPLFMSDMRAITEAQTARGVNMDEGGMAHKIRLMAPLCVPLLVGSVRKVNTLALAAEMRGFGLRTAESGYDEYAFAACDYAGMAASVTLLAIAITVTFF